MHDCMVCLSAGSVNQWGVCEVCGEETEDTDSTVTIIAERSLLPDNPVASVTTD